MIRFILDLTLLLGFLILAYPLLAVENSRGKKDPRRRDAECLRIVQKMFRVFLKISGARVRVEGRENIPVDQAVLYVGNHRSYFDIVAGYINVPAPTGFVAKVEMLRYPILRTWMKNISCTFLDRDDIKAALKSILEGIENIKNGISMWIFPEGTRNSSEDVTKLLPFKEGSLKMAAKTGCPVVPVAMVGTDGIFERHVPFIRPSDVTVRFGEPFYIKDLGAEDRKHPAAYTRGVLQEMLTEMTGGGSGHDDKAQGTQNRARACRANGTLKLTAMEGVEGENDATGRPGGMQEKTGRY